MKRNNMNNRLKKKQAKKTPTTIHQVIKNCVKGDMITDGTRTWRVVESYKEGGECVIASPHNWSQEYGPDFEIWDDAQARISMILGLTVKNAIPE